MLGMSDFGLRALWSPTMLIAVTIIAVLYVLAVDQFRTKWFKDSSSVPIGKKIAMLSGLAIYYFAQGGPLDLLGHLVFSMHMLSMSLSYLVVPPLIIYGTPDWMLKRVLGVPQIGKFVRSITNPILTLVLFNILFSMYHLPSVLDYVMTHFVVHKLFFATLLISAFMMWWNVVCPLPEYTRLNEVKKMGYIFANGVLLTPACALIIFAESTLYATYSDPAVWAEALGYCVPLGSDVILSMFNGPGEFGFMPPLDDQQFGGVMMKLMQEVMYGAILFYIFMNWFRKDKQNNSVDPIDSLHLVKN